jgi:hypothetical protein
MTGGERITASVLELLWSQTAEAFRSELAESKASVQDLLQSKNPAGISSVVSISTLPRTAASIERCSRFW